MRLRRVDRGARKRLLAVLLSHAVDAGRRRVGLRVQTAQPEPFLRLLELGWRVHWTDLRMTLAGHPESPPSRGVVLSNWEV